MTNLSRRFTKEQKDFLLKVSPYYNNKELVGLFKNKFGIELKPDAFMNFKHWHKIKRKYKPHSENYKGNPRRELYNEIETYKGRYVRIGAKKYQTKRRFVWEQYYDRKIPKGYDVIHLDGNKENYDIKNLAIVKKSVRISALHNGIELNSKDAINTTRLTLNLKNKSKQKEKEYKDMWLKDIFKKEKEKEYIEMKQKTLYEEALEKCKNNEEIWVEVKDYPKYEVSNLGNCRNKKTKLMIGYKDNTENTMKVQLQNEKGMKRTTIANIVAKNFELPNPYNLRYAKSLDGDKYNCRLDNLSWTTNLKKRDEMLFDEEAEYSDKDRIDNELANKKIEVNESPEVWRDVVNYERWYEVSNKGNVRRIEVDGSRTLLKATYKEGRARAVGLRMTGPTRTITIMKLVAQAFNIKPTKDNDRNIYHINGDMGDDRSCNLTYDITQTDEYIKEQEKIKEEQIRLAQEKIEKEAHKKEQENYINENKDFLLQAREMNKEVSLKDIYDKLCEILEALKNDNR